MNEITTIGLRSTGLNPARPETPLADWARTLLSKKPFKLVAVALANKMARIAWAVMAKDIDYEPDPMATSLFR